MNFGFSAALALEIFGRAVLAPLGFGRRPFRAFGCGDFAGLAGSGGPRWPVAVLVWVKLLQIFFATPEMLISFEGEKKNPTLEKLI